MSTSTPGKRQETARSQGALTNTRWTTVMSAAQGSVEALAELYQKYKRPLLGWLKRRGLEKEAEDLLQGFFTHLIEKRGFTKIRQRERFRSWLFQCLRNYQIDQYKKWKSREGSAVHLAVTSSDDDKETGTFVEPVSPGTPDQDFDREWALQVLDHALSRLEAEYSKRNKEHVFQILHHNLASRKAGAPYAKAAKELEMSEGAIKIEVFRMRARYHEVINEEIADTLANPTVDAVKDEKQALLASLSRS